MKTVKVYIETTITGPFVRDGKYEIGRAHV